MTPSRKPIRKLRFGLGAGALSTIALWLLDLAIDQPIPPIVAAAIATAFTGGAAYQTPSEPGELPPAEPAS